jgi:hypothetical protein
MPSCASRDIAATHNVGAKEHWEAANQIQKGILNAYVDRLY